MTGRVLIERRKDIPAYWNHRQPIRGPSTRESKQFWSKPDGVVSRALFELFEETTGVLEARLKAKITEIDLRDGQADGRITPKAKRCPQCLHPVRPDADWRVARRDPRPPRGFLDRSGESRPHNCRRNDGFVRAAGTSCRPDERNILHCGFIMRKGDRAATCDRQDVARGADDQGVS